MISATATLAGLAGLVPLASAHIAFWHNSMYGFNVTQQTFDYDNRPVAPLVDLTFEQWWFHGHLDYPPNAGDTFDLPAGGVVTAELSCDKGATSWYNSSSGGLAGYPSPDYACPGQPSSEFHTTSIDDVKGCALAIAYKSDANDVQPDDFVVFSVNHTCVWYTDTNFAVPAAMPACPDGGCTCAWFWIHSDDDGAEQMYMNGFHCDVNDATSTTPIGTPMLPRLCGEDTSNNIAADPGNCTIGPKYPMYWMQAEGNNMPEGYYDPPFYNDEYGFADGAQDDIFQDAYISSLGPSGATASASSTSVSNADVLTGSASSASATPTATTTSAAGASSSAAASSSTATASATTALDADVDVVETSASASTTSAAPAAATTSATDADISATSASSSTAASASSCPQKRNTETRNMVKRHKRTMAHEH